MRQYNRFCVSLSLLLSVGTALPPVFADELDNWDRPDPAKLKTMTPKLAPLSDGGLPLASDKQQVAQKVPGAPAAKAGLPAMVPQGSSAVQSGTVLKGGVTYVVPKGTPLKLKLATIPIPELRQELRDEEGNLQPAQLNQVVTAKITEDLFIDDNKVIPEGTVFHGKVSKLIAPRHVGRPGHLEIKFDHFTTPDGRSFAFKVEANNFKPSTPKTKLKGFGEIMAHAAGGAAVGTLIAYQLFGMRGTIATHGYNIAGGAAAGAVAGIGWALWRRGKDAVLEPGDEFQMAIDTDLLIPAATNPSPKKPPISLPGLEIELVKKKTFKDPLGGGRMWRLELSVLNQTRHRLNSIDLFLEDELGNRYPVAPDIDDETETVFHIDPLCTTHVSVAFRCEFPKLKHKLIWCEHQHQDHVLLEQAI